MKSRLFEYEEGLPVSIDQSSDVVERSDTKNVRLYLMAAPDWLSLAVATMVWVPTGRIEPEAPTATSKR